MRFIIKSISFTRVIEGVEERIICLLVGCKVELVTPTIEKSALEPSVVPID